MTSTTEKTAPILWTTPAFPTGFASDAKTLTIDHINFNNELGVKHVTKNTSIRSMFRPSEGSGLVNITHIGADASTMTWSGASSGKLSSAYISPKLGGGPVSGPWQVQLSTQTDLGPKSESGPGQEEGRAPLPPSPAHSIATRVTHTTPATVCAGEAALSPGRLLLSTGAAIGARGVAFGAEVQVDPTPEHLRLGAPQLSTLPAEPHRLLFDYSVGVEFARPGDFTASLLGLDRLRRWEAVYSVPMSAATAMSTRVRFEPGGSGSGGGGGGAGPYPTRNVQTTVQHALDKDTVVKAQVDSSRTVTAAVRHRIRPLAATVGASYMFAFGAPGAAVAGGASLCGVQLTMGDD